MEAVVVMIRVMLESALMLSIATAAATSFASLTSRYAVIVVRSGSTHQDAAGALFSTMVIQSLEWMH